MNNNKTKLTSKLVHHSLIGVVVLFFIACLGTTKVLVGLLNKQADILVGYKARVQALSQEQTNLKLAKKEVAKYSTLEKIAESIVPQDKGQAQTVSEIVSLAAANHITLTSINFPTSNLGETGTKTAATRALVLSQLTQVKGIPGVYMLPINVSDSTEADATSYTNFYNFLSQLEQNRRTSQVTNLSIQPVSNTTLINFTLTIDEYIKPR